MFLLNYLMKSFQLRNLTFTIQNVPIKLRTKIKKELSKYYLQYKMFLLNCKKILTKLYR